jgi:hypothetical protein
MRWVICARNRKARPFALTGERERSCRAHDRTSTVTYGRRTSLTSKRSLEPSANPNQSRPGASACTRHRPSHRSNWPSYCPNYGPNYCPNHCSNPNRGCPKRR